jgi:hypothetical protein
MYLPAKYKLQKYVTEVRDDKNDWATNCESIGWCSWDSNKLEFSPDGGVNITLGLNNWSGDRHRSIRIVANVE